MSSGALEIPVPCAPPEVVAHEINRGFAEHGNVASYVDAAYHIFGGPRMLRIVEATADGFTNDQRGDVGETARTSWKAGGVLGICASTVLLPQEALKIMETRPLKAMRDAIDLKFQDEERIKEAGRVIIELADEGLSWQSNLTYTIEQWAELFTPDDGLHDYVTKGFGFVMKAAEVAYGQYVHQVAMRNFQREVDAEPSGFNWDEALERWQG